MRRDAAGYNLQGCRRRLAPSDHGLDAARAELTGLEAQARVIAGQARAMIEAAYAPFFVDDGEQAEPGELLSPFGEELA